MSEQTYDTDDQTEEKLVTLRRSEIKVLEKKARQFDEINTDYEQMKRRLAFAEAGLPLGDKRIAYFVKGYEGDLTTDAILAAAQEAGFITTEEQAPQEGQTTVEGEIERQALGAIYSASQGAGTPQPGDPTAGLAKAFEEGGVDAMSAFLQSQGVPLSED